MVHSLQSFALTRSFATLSPTLNGVTTVAPDAKGVNAPPLMFHPAVLVGSPNVGWKVPEATLLPTIVVYVYVVGTKVRTRDVTRKPMLESEEARVIVIVYCS